MTAPSRPALPLWKKLLFGAVVLTLALGAPEIGLRLSGWGPAYRADFAGWRMPTDLNRHTMQPQTEQHRFVVSTNSEGLRTGLPREARPDAIRVAILGDSTAFGWGVDDGEDLPSRLEHHLRERGVHRAEVLNAAQPGYTTAQLLALFESTVHEWKPDVAVLFIPQHDRTPALVSDWEHYEGSRGPLDLIRVLLARHSRTYHFLWTSLSEVPGPDAADGVMMLEGGVVRVPRVSDSERDEAVDRFREGLDDWGGQLVLGLMPYYPDLSATPDNPGEDGPHVPWHRDYASSRGVPLIDVRSCCGPDPDAMVFPFDKWHLNARGNDAVASALAAELLRAGLVDVTP